MKILALVTDVFGAPGGIAQYNQDFLTALANQPDIKQKVVLPRHGIAEKAPEKINQHASNPGKLAYTVKTMWQAIKFKPELVFCGHLNFLPLAWLAAKLSGAKLWLQLHGIDAWQKPAYLSYHLIEKVDFVTCPMCQDTFRPS